MFRTVGEQACRRPTGRSALVLRAMAVIQAECADPMFTTKALATRCGKPQAAFGKAFFAELGLYPYEYLRNVRLDRAAAFLSTTSRRVKEVWAAVGYRDGSAFDHDFKKRFGVTPSRYRIHDCREPKSTNIALAPPVAKRGSPSSIEARVDRKAILVVDDDESTRETIGRYLRLEGFAVTVAGSGLDALAEARTTRVDAVLLDYHLPDLEGMDCLAALRDLDVQVPVVMFSADWELQLSVQELTALNATMLFKVC